LKKEEIPRTVTSQLARFVQARKYEKNTRKLKEENVLAEGENSWKNWAA